MKLRTKIWSLMILFSIRGILYLIEGILRLFELATYGEYVNAFINAGIMGYIAYLIFAKRNKWTYWFAVIFSGFVLLRSVVAIGLFIYSGIFPSTGFTTLMILNGVIFGVVPLLLLTNKELRSSFLIFSAKS